MVVKPLDRTINQLPRQFRDKLREIIREMDNLESSGTVSVDSLMNAMSSSFIDETNKSEGLMHALMTFPDGDLENKINDLEFFLQAVC